MITKKTLIHPYRMPLVAIITDDHKELVRFFKRQAGYIWEDDDENVFAHSILTRIKWRDDYWRSAVVIFNLKSNNRITIGTVAHEAIHAADFVFETHGLRHDTQNPEPMTYLVEFVTDFLSQFLIENGWNPIHKPELPF